MRPLQGADRLGEVELLGQAGGGAVEQAGEAGGRAGAGSAGAARLAGGGRRRMVRPGLGAEQLGRDRRAVVAEIGPADPGRVVAGDPLDEGRVRLGQAGGGVARRLGLAGEPLLIDGGVGVACGQELLELGEGGVPDGAAQDGRCDPGQRFARRSASRPGSASTAGRAASQAASSRASGRPAPPATARPRYRGTGLVLVGPARAGVRSCIPAGAGARPRVRPAARP